MSDHSTEAAVPDLQLVIERQKALGKRLMWLLLVPFIITGVLVYMFIVIKNELASVQTSSKLVQIELILGREHNYQWAIREYETIAQYHKSSPILARLGTLYFLANHNDTPRALSTLLEANRLDPLAWEPYRGLTFVYATMDKPKEALKAGKKALKFNGLDANAYNNLAWVCSHTQNIQYRDLSLALEYGKKAVELSNERDPDYIDTLAGVYMQFEDLDSQHQAVALLKKAVMISPNDRKSNFIAHLREHFPEEKLED